MRQGFISWFESLKETDKLDGDEKLERIARFSKKLNFLVELRRPDVIGKIVTLGSFSQGETRDRKKKINEWNNYVPLGKLGKFTFRWRLETIIQVKRGKRERELAKSRRTSRNWKVKFFLRGKLEKVKSDWNRWRWKWIERSLCLIIEIGKKRHVGLWSAVK